MRFRDLLLILRGATSGEITLKAAAVAGTNTLTLPAGTTDFSATGGTSQVVKQTSAGGALTVARLAAGDLSDWTAGTDDTPTVTAGSGTFTTVSGSQRYWKLNGIGFVTGFVTITTNGSAAGSVQVTTPAALLPLTTSLCANAKTNGSLSCNANGLLIGGTTQGIAIVKYDGTYPGGTGVVLNFSYFVGVT